MMEWTGRPGVLIERNKLRDLAKHVIKDTGLLDYLLKASLCPATVCVEVSHLLVVTIRHTVCPFPFLCTLKELTR